MKLAVLTLLLVVSVSSFSQATADNSISCVPVSIADLKFNIKEPAEIDNIKRGKKIRINNPDKWRLSKNKIITGGLVFLAGSAKGFNEGLQFNYPGFKSIFPRANAQWFYPTLSFRNKYKDGDPEKGAKFPLSTSLLVMFTDQYHLNNFIQRASLTAALVIKIGDGKKSFKHYLLDALYYTAAYQAGFHSVYYPIKMRNK